MPDEANDLATWCSDIQRVLTDNALRDMLAEEPADRRIVTLPVAAPAERATTESPLPDVRSLRGWPTPENVRFASTFSAADNRVLLLRQWYESLFVTDALFAAVARHLMGEVAPPLNVTWQAWLPQRHRAVRDRVLVEAQLRWRELRETALRGSEVADAMSPVHSETFPSPFQDDHERFERLVHGVDPGAPEGDRTVVGGITRTMAAEAVASVQAPALPGTTHADEYVYYLGTRVAVAVLAQEMPTMPPPGTVVTAGSGPYPANYPLVFSENHTPQRVDRPEPRSGASTTTPADAQVHVERQAEAALTLIRERLAAQYPQLLAWFDGQATTVKQILQGEAEQVERVRRLPRVQEDLCL